MLTSCGPNTLANTLVFPCSRKDDPSACLRTPIWHCNFLNSGGLRPSTLKP